MCRTTPRIEARKVETRYILQHFTDTRFIIVDLLYRLHEFFSLQSLAHYVSSSVPCYDRFVLLPRLSGFFGFYFCWA